MDKVRDKPVGKNESGMKGKGEKYPRIQTSCRCFLPPWFSWDLGLDGSAGCESAGFPKDKVVSGDPGDSGLASPKIWGVGVLELEEKNSLRGRISAWSCLNKGEKRKGKKAGIFNWSFRLLSLVL